MLLALEIDAKSRKKCADTQVLSNFAGFLFVAYPVSSEAVYALVGRADMLIATLLLLVLLRIADEPQNEWLMLAAACIAITVKETGIVLFPLFQAAQRVLHSERKYHPSGKIPSNAAKIFAILVASRVALTPQLASFSQLDNDVPSRLHALGLVYENVKQMVLPASLCHDWSKGTYSLSLQNFTGAFLILILIGKLYLENDKFMKTSLLISAFLYMPISNLISRVGFIRAERCLYPVSIGFLFLTLKITSRAMTKLKVPR